MTQTAKDITDQFIYRAKNLQMFTVETDVPESFRFNGPVPFYLKIEEGVIYAEVYALSFNEACEIFNEYIEGCK
jgi:hypothetical protein